MNSPSLQESGSLRTTASSAISEGEINLREIFDLIWSGKWLILAVAMTTVMVTALYVWTATPIYEASGLVQVEQQASKGLDATISELSTLMGGSGQTATTAEITLIGSRMVLGAVAEKLNLPIVIKPNYFPLVGSALARQRKHLSEPAPAFLGLESFAWGGEKIKVTTFDVPSNMADTSFVLEAGAFGGFNLFTKQGNLLLTGKVGELAEFHLPTGDVKLFVQELVARPKTKFSLVRLSDQKTYGLMQGGLTVMEAAKDSGVIQITYDNDNADDAAKIINTIEETYLRQNVERRSEEAEQSLQFVTKQLPEIKRRLDEAQAKLNAYQLQKGTADVQKETELALNRAVELEAQRLALQQQREAAMQRFTSQHPVIMAIDDQLRGVADELSKLKGQVQKLPERQQEIFSLMRELQVNSQLYITLLNSSQQLQVAKAGTVGNVRIIDSALTPLEPASPKKILIMTGGIFAGLILGLLVLFLRRALIRGVDRPEDVENVLGLATYASIPYSPQQRKMEAARSGGKSADLLAVIDSADPAVEALRSLRTSLQFLLLEAKNNVVMMTGPVPGIGKSFISVNLGAVLALGKKKVVVVDCDLRRGRVHHYIKSEAKVGLSDYVADPQMTAGQLLRSSGVEGLTIITRGVPPPNPAEILLNERFTRLIEQLSAEFDLVILDTPPALLVTDAAIIGRLASCTLIVLKEAEHTMRAIEETARRLTQAGVIVRGVLFNQVGMKLGSYGYYGYGYNYRSKY